MQAVSAHAVSSAAAPQVAVRAMATASSSATAPSHLTVANLSEVLTPLATCVFAHPVVAREQREQLDSSCAKLRILTPGPGPGMTSTVADPCARQRHFVGGMVYVFFCYVLWLLYSGRLIQPVYAYRPNM